MNTEMSEAEATSGPRRSTPDLPTVPLTVHLRSREDAATFAMITNPGPSSSSTSKDPTGKNIFRSCTGAPLEPGSEFPDSLEYVPNSDLLTWRKQLTAIHQELSKEKQYLRGLEDCVQLGLNHASERRLHERSTLSEQYFKYKDKDWDKEADIDRLLQRHDVETTKANRREKRILKDLRDWGKIQQEVETKLQSTQAKINTEAESRVQESLRRHGTINKDAVELMDIVTPSPPDDSSALQPPASRSAGKHKEAPTEPSPRAAPTSRGTGLFRCVSEARVPVGFPVRVRSKGPALHSCQPFLSQPPMWNRNSEARDGAGRLLVSRAPFRRSDGYGYLVMTPEDQVEIHNSSQIRMVCSRGLAGTREPWVATQRFSGSNPGSEEIRGLVFIPKALASTHVDATNPELTMGDHALNQQLAGRLDNIVVGTQELSLGPATHTDHLTIHVPVAQEQHLIAGLYHNRRQENRTYLSAKETSLDCLGNLLYGAFSRVLVLNAAPRKENGCLMGDCHVQITDWAELKVHIQLKHPCYIILTCPRPGCGYTCMALSQLLYHTQMIHQVSLQRLLQQRYRNCQEGCGYVVDSHDLQDYRSHTQLKHQRRTLICSCCRLGYVDLFSWVTHQWPSFTGLHRVEQGVNKIIAVVQEHLSRKAYEYQPFFLRVEDRELGIVGSNCDSFPDSLPL